MSIKRRIEKLEERLIIPEPPIMQWTIRIFDRLSDGKFYIIEQTNPETGNMEKLDPPIPLAREEIGNH